jgi:hyperosmotically inducible periplasmic protein
LELICALKTKVRNSASSHAALLSLPTPSTKGEVAMKRSILTRTLVAAFALGSALPMAATFAAGATEKGNDSNQPVNDTWITTKVKAELATTDGVKSNDIDVKTVNGVVTLTGMLPTDVAVKKAVAAAESIQGVKKVDHSGLKSK